MYQVKVDWLSFTIPIIIPDETTHDKWVARVNRTVMDYLGDLWEYIASTLTWETGIGRRPYIGSIGAKNTSIKVWHSPRVDTVLFELGGRGMDTIRDMGLEMELYRKVVGRITRVDIATDILTDCSPSAFVVSGYNKRIKRRGSEVSATGETEYIGSRKSDQYCKVYRYYPPHERADNLRIEFTAKKPRANQVVEIILKDGVEVAMRTMHERYKFNNSLWEITNGQVSKFPAIEGDEKSNNTKRWFEVQVFPAFKRLVDNGDIKEPEKWLKGMFLDKLT